jgi:hypothetical protein
MVKRALAVVLQLGIGGGVALVLAEPPPPRPADPDTRPAEGAVIRVTKITGGRLELRFESVRGVAEPAAGRPRLRVGDRLLDSCRPADAGRAVVCVLDDPAPLRAGAVVSLQLGDGEPAR